VLVGARELDPAEDDYLEVSGIPLLDVATVTSKKLVAAIRKTKLSRVYIHVDLDVLDPAEFDGLDSPVPFGLSPAAVVELIRAVRTEFELVGAGITEFAPTSPDAAAGDLPNILRIIGALTAK
jgi:arginase